MTDKPQEGLPDHAADAFRYGNRRLFPPRAGVGVREDLIIGTIGQGKGLSVSRNAHIRATVCSTMAASIYAYGPCPGRMIIASNPPQSSRTL